MDTVKINFLGFWDNFDKNNNKITQALKKNFKVQISNNPDFVFYTFWLKGSCPYGEHVKIFYSYEPHEIGIDDYNYLITCRKDFYPNSDKILTYHPIPGLNIFQKQKVSTKLTKRKFCNFVYANTIFGENAKRRIEFCKELSKYKPVDCPGQVLNNMKHAISSRNGNWEKGKLDFIRNYKFTIAFENHILNGYSTEKLYHPLLVKSVPIYSGDPNIKNYYNNKAFINVDDYKSWDDAIEYIVKLDNDDELYMQMIKEMPVAEEFDYDKKLKEFLYKIVKAGNNHLTRCNRLVF